MIIPTAAGSASAAWYLVLVRGTNGGGHACALIDLQVTRYVLFFFGFFGGACQVNPRKETTAQSRAAEARGGAVLRVRVG